MAVNNIILQGRLVRDPELRHTNTGTAVASFTLAVNRDYAAQGEERKADFIDIVAWRNTAEFVSRNFCRGKECIVIGRLETRTYTDKSGNNRKAFEVNANSVHFTAGVFGVASTGNDAPAQQTWEEITEPDDGGLPF